MSREFHWTGHDYLHSILADVGVDRPVTGEPVADAIRDFLIAIAPIEREVANHQAHDSGLSAVVLAAVKHRDQVEDAAAALIVALAEYGNLATEIVRKATSDGGPLATPAPPTSIQGDRQ